MCSTDHRSTPVVPRSPQPPNTFAAEFLSRLVVYVLEEAGSVTLERCGAILDEQAAAPE